MEKVEIELINQSQIDTFIYNTNIKIEKVLKIIVKDWAFKLILYIFLPMETPYKKKILKSLYLIF